MLLALARNGDRVINETLLTVASIVLIATSVLWVVVSRVVLRNLRKAASIPTASIKAPPSRDIWREPPPPPPSASSS